MEHIIRKVFKKFLSLISSYILNKFLYVGILIWFIVCIIFPILSVFLMISLYSLIIYQKIFKYKVKKVIFPNFSILRATIFILLSIFFVYGGYMERTEKVTNQLSHILDKD